MKLRNDRKKIKMIMHRKVDVDKMTYKKKRELKNTRRKTRENECERNEFKTK